MSAEQSGQRAPAGLADTSVFIARENGRPVGRLPDRISVSVVTVGELQLGVLLATDRRTRALRGATLDVARRSDPIPLTEAIMQSWAVIAQACTVSGVARRIQTFDALIAATAENPLDASAVDFKTTAGRLTGQPRMKIEALAHFVRRARQNGASITLTAFRE